jgi:hypothetical protein
MNRKKVVTLEETVKLYANLKFEEKGVATLNPGTTVTFEETGKVYTDPDGKDCKVLRLRKTNRNYYILEPL